MDLRDLMLSLFKETCNKGILLAFLFVLSGSQERVVEMKAGRSCSHRLLLVLSYL